MKEKTYTTGRNNHALAIVSLVLSILGLIGVLPLIGSIGGIISGQIARREIRENPDQYGGDDLARAGVVLGWVGAVIGLVALCLLGFGLLFFLTFKYKAF